MGERSDSISSDEQGSANTNSKAEWTRRSNDYWQGIRFCLYLVLIILIWAVIWSASVQNFGVMLAALPVMAPVIFCIVWDTTEFLFCKFRGLGGAGVWSDPGSITLGVLLPSVIGCFVGSAWVVIALGLDFPTGATQALLLASIPFANRLLCAEKEKVVYKNQTSANSPAPLAKWRELTLFSLSGVAIAASIIYGMIELLLVLKIAQHLSSASYAIELLQHLFWEPWAPISAICLAAPIVGAAMSIILNLRLQQCLENETRTRGKIATLVGIALGFILIFVPTLPHTWQRKLAYEIVNGEKYTPALAHDYWRASSSGQASEYVTMQAIQDLRKLGRQDLLLEDCYGPSAEIAEYLSCLVTESSPRYVSNEDFCNVFYRVYGKPYNEMPIPWKALPAIWARDFQRGSQEVGAKVAGLSLAESKMTGLIDANAAVSYLEWDMAFKNDTDSEKEVRLQIALPPHAVASRAALWVRGRPRDAAFTERGVATATYRSIVAEKRDPLLLSAAGPDRVLLQCFPVPPHGQLKAVVGITAPLNLEENNNCTLLLPAIIEKNFDKTNDHDLNIESSSSVEFSGAAKNFVHEKIDAHAVRAKVADELMSKTPLQLTVKRAEPPDTEHWSPDMLDAKEYCVAKFIDDKSRVINHATIVVDASISLAQFKEQVARAIAEIPANIKTNLMVATDDVSFLSDNHKHQKLIPIDAKTAGLIRNLSFVGGPPNWQALQDAWIESSKEEGGAVIWIHGPQPDYPKGFHPNSNLFRFRLRPSSNEERERMGAKTSQSDDIAEDSRSEAALSTLKFSKNSAAIFDFEVANGVNRIRESLDAGSYKFAPEIVSIRRGGDVYFDLKRFFDKLKGKQPDLVLSVSKSNIKPSAEEVKFKPLENCLSKLWANKQVEHLLEKGQGAEAIKLASDYKIVTPVSAAIVLEFRQQYKDAGIAPPTQIASPAPTGGGFAIGSQLNQLNSVNSLKSAPASMPKAQAESSDSFDSTRSSQGSDTTTSAPSPIPHSIEQLSRTTSTAQDQTPKPLNETDSTALTSTVSAEGIIALAAFLLFATVAFFLFRKTKKS